MGRITVSSDKIGGISDSLIKEGNECYLVHGRWSIAKRLEV